MLIAKIFLGICSLALVFLFISLMRLSLDMPKAYTPTYETITYEETQTDTQPCVIKVGDDFRYYSSEAPNQITVYVSSGEWGHFEKEQVINLNGGN